MKKGFSFFVVMFSIFFLFSLNALAAPAGSVTKILGSADITAPGKGAQELLKGDPVNVGDILRTKSRAKLEITFRDGSILRMAEKSRLEITEYMVQDQQTSSTLKLFRGKIQSVVKRLSGQVFGQKRNNRYEVHTPTAVCGVRGTNFFTYYLGGVSGAIFKEGQGYGYSIANPEQIVNIATGQAMIVTGDAPPVIKPSSDSEIQGFLEDVFIGDDEGGSGGDDLGAPDPGDLSGDLGGGGTGDTGGGTLLQDPIYIPPLEDEYLYGTTFSISLAEAFLAGSFPSIFSNPVGTLDASINPLTNTGTLSIQGTDPIFPPDIVWGDEFTGDLVNGGQVAGTLQGVTGSWNAVMAAIYVSGGQAGYFLGTMDGTSVYSDADELFQFSGSGPLVQIAMGATDVVVNEENPITENLVSLELPLPFLLPHIGTATWSTDYFEGFEIVPDGTILGVWGVQEAYPDFYYPTGDSAWSGLFGTYDSGQWYMFGDFSVADDLGIMSEQEGEFFAQQSAFETLTGHVTIAGFDMMYMDSEYLGNINFIYKGTYDNFGYYWTAGAGTFTLDPLAFTGTWGTGGGTVYWNSIGGREPAYYDTGLIGGLTLPWDGGPFYVMGDYFGDGTSDPAIPMLWDSPIFAWDVDDSSDELLGATMGFWRELPEGASYSTLEDGAAYAVYLVRSTNEAGILYSPVSGYSYDPVLGMWAAQGDWSTLLTESVTETTDYSEFSFNTFFLGASAGDFGDGIVSLGSEVGGTSAFLSDNGIGLPWGIFVLAFDRGAEGISYYSDKPAGTTTWDAMAGGSGIFDSVIDSDYWIAAIDGSWTPTGILATGEEVGLIDGGITGAYISQTHIGTLAGDFWGTFTADTSTGDTGTWIGEGLGTFEGLPAEFMASVDGDYYQTNPDFVYDPYSFGLPPYTYTGLIEGLIGGTSSFLTGDPGFLSMGPLYLYPAGAEGVLQGSLDFGTYGDTGLWTGYFATSVVDDTSLSSDIRAVYYDFTNDDYGFLKGTGTGEAYPEINMFLVDQGTSLTSSTALYGTPNGGVSGMNVSGDVLAEFKTIDNDEVTPWGYWFAGVEGTYDAANPPPAGPLDIGGTMEDEQATTYYLGTLQLPAAWPANTEGTFGGDSLYTSVTLKLMNPVYIGLAMGEASGVFDGVDTYLAVASGLWNMQPLAFSAEFSGDLFTVAPGTLYEGSFQRLSSDPEFSYDAEYAYAYFIPDLYAEGEDVYAGGTDFMEFMVEDGNDEEIAYLPDGTKRTYPDDDSELIIGSWTPGELGPEDFTVNPYPGSWEDVWSDQWATSGIIPTGGSISGVMGSTMAISYGGSLDMMGEYTAPGDSQPLLFGMEIRDSGIYPEGTTLAGFFGGIIDENVWGNMSALFITPGGDIGILQSSDIQGTAYPGIGMWDAQAGYISWIQAFNAGVTPADMDTLLQSFIIDGWGELDFGGSGFFTDVIYGNTLSLAGFDEFGVFDMIVGIDNRITWDGAPSSSMLAGYAGFGYVDTAATPVPDIGYWTLSSDTGYTSLDVPVEGGLDAGLNGEFLTYTKTGWLSADLAGAYTVDGWEAFISGYWNTTQPLEFAGEILDGKVMYTTGESTPFLAGVGWFDGILGGLDDLSAGTAALKMMGEYDTWNEAAAAIPTVFSSDVWSYNASDDSFTIMDPLDGSQNGAFMSFLTGVIDPSAISEITGSVAGIYLDDVGNAGFLLGDFQGDTYSDMETWQAMGGVATFDIGIGGFSPATLEDDLVKNETWVGGMGAFRDSYGFISGNLTTTSGMVSTAGITDQPWGVWSSLLGGSWDLDNSWMWLLYLESRNEFADLTDFGILATQSFNTWLDGTITAPEVAGAWANLDEVVPTTMVTFGQLAGTFDPEGTTWQAAASGVWIETGTYLAMAADATTGVTGGLLDQLNIPFVEIGVADLTGSIDLGDGDHLSVAMNDVTFLNRTGDPAPEVWATNSITGTYQGTDLAGTSVPLTGSGLVVDFSVNRWDSSIWGATVSGDGTFTATLIPETPTTDIIMDGVAAGTYGDGFLDGTAAGVATSVSGF